MGFIPRMLCMVVMAIAWYNPLSAQEQLLREDVVYLRNGHVIRGLIVSRQSNPSVKIVTREGNTQIYAMKDVQRVSKEAVRLRRTKNPDVAMVLALGGGIIADGGGQWYNGDRKKSLFFLGWSTVSNVLIWRGLEDNFRNTTTNGAVQTGSNEDPDNDDVYMYIGIFSRVVSYVAATIDARRSAKWKAEYISTRPVPTHQFGLNIIPILTPRRKGVYLSATGRF